MGKRGPKPQPSAVRKARGNPGKRGLNKNEPRPAGKLPAAPPHLAGAARATYEAWAQQLTGCGIATSIDATALEMLCTAYAEYLGADQKVREHGTVWMEKGESKIPKFAYSPYWVIRNRAWTQVAKLLAEFGMTPSSRSRVERDPDAESSNPFAAYLKLA